MGKTHISAAFIKSTAQKFGFHNCGLSRAGFLEGEAGVLEKWLKDGKHGSMSYMERYFDMRLDPRRLQDGAKTIISLIYNYNCRGLQHPKSFYYLAKYARLADYHHFLKAKMRAVVKQMQAHIGHFEYSCFVDSAPVLERAWAVKSGLGNIGKNKCLIIPNAGSYFFICQIITDFTTSYDRSLNKSICKGCNKCIEACPTGAINEVGSINAHKCISYLTIEHKKDMEGTYKNKIYNQVFGCDLCQIACPYNQQAPINQEADTFFIKELPFLTKEKWEIMSEPTFKSVFKNTTLFRSGYKKIKKNVSFVMPNSINK